MKRLLKNIPAIAFLIFAYGCTDPVNIKLKEGDIQLAVDGSITDQSSLGTTVLPDTVRLTWTNGFSSGPSPIVDNALVIMADNGGNVDTLTYFQNGEYFTHPAKIQGKIGHTYLLTVAVDGETYQATDEMKRNTTIDSILIDYRKDSQFGRASGYFINLFANDLPGAGDFYRLKVYKNGVLYNRPTDLDIAADAGIGSNNPIDGLRFIYPIREALNPFTNKQDPSTGGDEAPFLLGDRVRVDINSLSTTAYNFYIQLQTQITNDGLFAGPAVNVSTNVINTNPSSNKTAVGLFYATAIASKIIVIRPVQ